MAWLSAEECIRNCVVAVGPTRATPEGRVFDPTSVFFFYSFFLPNDIHSFRFASSPLFISFLQCFGKNKEVFIFAMRFALWIESKSVVQTRFSLSLTISLPHRRTSRSIHLLWPKYGAGVTGSRRPAYWRKYVATRVTHLPPRITVLHQHKQNCT